MNKFANGRVAVINGELVSLVLVSAFKVLIVDNFAHS